jgi:hypothetical protein
MEFKKYIRVSHINVTAVLSQKTKRFTSLQDVETSTGVSLYILRLIKKGQMSNLVRGKKDILFLIEFVYKDKAVTLTPAWDTSLDGTKPQEVSSHYAAIHRFGFSKSTYYRRMREQPIGEPCHTPLKDSFNREWIATFHRKGDFDRNKKGE